MSFPKRVTPITSSQAMSPEILGPLPVSEPICLALFHSDSFFRIYWERLILGQAGSRNIGFTNVLRVSGKKVGILTLSGDLGKGWLVGWLASLGFLPNLWALLAVLSVVLGHLFPVFFKFSWRKRGCHRLGRNFGPTFSHGVCSRCDLGCHSRNLEIFVWRSAYGLRDIAGGKLVHDVRSAIYDIQPFPEWPRHWQT